MTRLGFLAIALCVGSTSTAGCQDGSCITCAKAGLGDCDGVCKPISFDNNNCGACGHVCEPFSICVYQTCVSGTATCDPGCGSNGVCCAANADQAAPFCSNILTDVANCGGCGHACGVGMECGGGTCTMPSGGGD